MTSEVQEDIKKAARAGVRTVLKAPTDRLPLKTSFYHAAVMAVPYLNKATESISEAVRVCRPGSPVVITTYLGENDRGWLEEALSTCKVKRPFVFKESPESLHLMATGICP